MPIRVVNMIPNSMSNETQRDAECNISATFLDPSRIAASAFTPDPLSSGNAPIYLSTDGGENWVLNVILPGGNKTNDTTLRFAGPSNVLYAGILRTDTGALNILRKADFTTPGLADVLVSKSNDDQPYVEAATVMAGAGTGADRVYVGENDFGGGATSATIDFSLDAATAPAPAGFVTTSRVEKRTTSGQDGPAIRPAVHLDGTVYGAFLSWKSASTMDVVVVRDDNWASGATPFTSLVDTGDSKAGKRVALAVSRPPFNDPLGTQRTSGTIAIAVDPANSSNVWVAWSDGASGATLTIHVRHSTDRGVTWSADVRTISTATNPSIAVNRNGQVGFLFQQLHNPGSGNRWQTHLQVSSNNFSTATDFILADVPDANGSYGSTNPIGDYTGLIGVGKSFYGIFSGNNTPDNANFPNGVRYQRNANFTTHTLLDLASNPVGVSIDPFFVKHTAAAPADDFYVRDWTDSATSGDNGVEPSTHAVFYATSDVWNRRGSLPGTFVNDQPPNEDAGNGAGNLGDNWAFARIRRNVAASSGSQTVSAHFLVSKFGTGSNYVDSTSVDPDVTFLDPDPTVVFNAADVAPVITAGCHWHLNAIASTHLCMAVEITGPNDPFLAPSLLGNAPGWPTTDLRIINDNNKAQRNMGLSTTPARGVGMTDCYYAIVHNAAPFPRDMELGYTTAEEVVRAFQGAVIEFPGGEDQKFAARGTLRLAGMQPGENRWIGLRFPAAAGKEGQTLAVNFFETEKGVVVNGFATGARLASMAAVIRERLTLHQSTFARLAALYDARGAKESADAAAKLARQTDTPEAGYAAFVKDQLKAMQTVLGELIKARQPKDPFRLVSALEGFARAVAGGQADAIAVAHGCILHKVDSLVTAIQLANGNVADILQTVRWQQYLFTTHPRLAQLEAADQIRRMGESFIQGYGRRRVTNKDYPSLIKSLLPLLQKIQSSLPAVGLPSPGAMEQLFGDLTRLQKAHSDFLVRLQAV